MEEVSYRQSRINRMTYFVWLLLGMTAILMVVFLVGFIIGVVSYSDPMLEGTVNTIATVTFYVMYFPFMYFVTTRRLHDLGRSNWYVLTLFIPFYSFVVGLELLFRSPEKGINKYGQEYEGIKLSKLFTSSHTGFTGPSGHVIADLSPADATASAADTDELMKYSEMHKSGLLTDEEWYAKKKELL